jgi:phosphopantetheinyl transferase
VKDSLLNASSDFAHLISVPEQHFSGVQIPLQRSGWSGRSLLGFASPPFSVLNSNRHQYLHLSEEKHFDQLYYERARHQYLLSRYTAKCALAHYLEETDIKAIAVEKGIFRQPLISYTKHPIPNISLAHTGGIGACIIFPREHPMGLDLEFPKNESLDSIAQMTTPIEKVLRAESLESDLSFYTRIWTAKEALSKVLGTGLTTPLHVYEVNQLIIKNNYTVSYFKNFTQYKAISFWVNHCICSIVLPKMTECYPSAWIFDGLNISIFEQPSS